MRFDFPKTYIQPIGFSKFEFRPTGSFRYTEGYLVWRLQNKQAWNGTLSFGPMESQASKFGTSVKTYKGLATINSKAYLQIDYCQSSVITQSAMDTPDNVL
jgi:hypothetical protein